MIEWHYMEIRENWEIISKLLYKMYFKGRYAVSILEYIVMDFRHHVSK